MTKAHAGKFLFVLWTASIAGLTTTNAAENVDRDAGAQLAGSGKSPGVAPCVTCHGIGRSRAPSNAFPLLVGQPAEYLYKQLNDYASGARQNPIMSPMAAALTEAERQNLAVYYGSLTPTANKSSPTTTGKAINSSDTRIARTLVELGSQDKGIQGCRNCHGPAALGEPPLNPQLAGQYEPYTRAQLMAFRSGERHNDVAGVMREIASKLSEHEIALLAAYLDSLPDGRQAAQ
jgi:cytochrome c553